MFDPIKPHFEYNKRSAFMSYHCADIINEFIDEHQDNYQPIKNKLYSYFPIVFYIILISYLFCKFLIFSGIK